MFVSPVINSTLLTVAKEIAKLAREDMIMELQEESFIELECTGELLRQLPHTVNELGEDWGELTRFIRNQATPAGKIGLFYYKE